MLKKILKLSLILAEVHIGDNDDLGIIAKKLIKLIEKYREENKWLNETAKNVR